MLLARGLESIRKRRSSSSNRRVRRDNLGQTVTAAGHVELLDRPIELAPKLIGPSPPGRRSQLIRGTRAVGPLHRLPRKASLQRPSVGITHRRGRLGKSADAHTELRIGRRQLMCAHRAYPRRLRLANGIPRRGFAGTAGDRATAF